MRTLSLLGPLLYTVGFARESFAADHAAHTIPWSSIGVQAFNLIFLLGLLTYLLKNSVREHFKARAKSFHDLVEKAERAKALAEKNRNEIRERIAKLDAGAEETEMQARSEAQELKQRMLKEATVLSEKLKQEANRSAQLEFEKARTELRHELLQKALVSARESLRKNVGSQEQKRLQNEFAEKIQVVGG